MRKPSEVRKSRNEQIRIAHQELIRAGYKSKKAFEELMIKYPDLKLRTLKNIVYGQKRYN